MLCNRRFGMAALIGLALLFTLTAQGAFAQASIKDTKHNFSTSGPGTIKAISEQQICVFCHTPHSASTSLAAPLWNRQFSSATYTLYSSDYLGPTASGGLGYPAPVQPKEKSKLCLSCHDGTIAIGSVYNLPGPGGAGTIAMANSGSPITTMPTTAAGHLGVNLADDHPVGYLYDAAKDPELKARAWPWNTAVKLDPDTSAGTLECHTCHNAHNNQFGKFLRMDNTNAALCTSCHNKTNYAVSGHATSNQAYTPAGGTATTVGNNSCINCHKPHGGLGTPLLRGAEENTCYDSGCHGNTIAGRTATTVTNLIQPEMSKTRRHPTNDLSGLHKDLPGGETQAQLGGAGAANRHAECQDCHNPHQVQLAVEKSVRGTLRISAALKGSWGVEPVWPAPPTAMTNNSVTFTSPTVFTKVSGDQLTDEYQVCLKCHSNYVTLPAATRDIATEINPGNSSYHGIVPGGVTNYYVNQNTMIQPWAGPNAYTVAQAEALRLAPAPYARGRVWCSDCHGSESSSIPPAKAAPYGPHGSTLTNAGPGTSNSDKMLIRTIAADTANGGTPLCLACHKATSYLTDTTFSRGSRHKADGIPGRAPEGCFSCHMWNNPVANNGVGTGKIYPHGMNMRWYTIGTQAAGSGSGQMTDAFNGGWYTNMDYTNKKCWTTNTGTVKPSGSPCNNHSAVAY